MSYPADIPSLQRKVAALKKARETQRLKDERDHADIPIDHKARYLTTQILADEVGRAKNTIIWHIQQGRLRARKASVNGQHMWVIHPDDAAKWKAQYFPPIQLAKRNPNGQKNQP